MLKRLATAILNGWGAVAGLYGIQISLILALVFAAGEDRAHSFPGCFTDASRWRP
jgi:hypothetical protein